jgi:hypothetical protein
VPPVRVSASDTGRLTVETCAPGLVSWGSAVTVQVNTALPTRLKPSVAVAVTVYVPAAVGAPLTRPAELIVRPVGSPLAAQVTGGAPPVALSWSAAATETSPTCAPGLLTAGACAVALALKTGSVETPLTSVEVTYEQADDGQCRSAQVIATTTRKNAM